MHTCQDTRDGDFLDWRYVIINVRKLVHHMHRLYHRKPSYQSTCNNPSFTFDVYHLHVYLCSQKEIINKLLRVGVPPYKLTLGITLKAQSYKLCYTDENGYGARGCGFGDPEVISKMNGTLFYYEVSTKGPVVTNCPTLICVWICLTQLHHFPHPISYLRGTCEKRN